MKKLIAAGLAASVLMSTAASAQEESKAKPTDVTANEMEVLDKENKTIFRGQVVAIRDKTTINCDQLLVNTVEVKQPDGTTKKEVDVMHATGNVKIVTESETITAEKADIYDRQDRLEAFGKVVLVQGTNTLKGEKLTVNLNDKHTVMTGGRVKGSFLPE